MLTCRSVQVSKEGALHFLVCLFDVLPGERIPHVCSVRSAGSAFIQRPIAGTHVRLRTILYVWVSIESCLLLMRIYIWRCYNDLPNRQI